VVSAASGPAGVALQCSSPGAWPFCIYPSADLLHRTKQIVGMGRGEVKPFFVRRSMHCATMGQQIPNIK
jgi:hypothetical protein